MGGLKIISFDLDNTLWSTHLMLHNADDVVLDYLEKTYPDSFKWISSDNSHRIEFFMKQKADEVAAKCLKDEEGRLIPVDYLNIRLSVLKHIAEKCNYKDCEKFAQEVFNVWFSARNNVEESLFGEDTIATLASLRERGYLLIALTNGNSSPKLLKPEVLASQFHFWYNAPKIGACKSDSHFWETVKKDLTNHIVSDIPSKFANNLLGLEMRDFKNNHTDQPSVSKSPFGFWLHVGDDLKTDIRSAKEQGFMTAWVTGIRNGNIVDECSWQPHLEHKCNINRSIECESDTEEVPLPLPDGVDKWSSDILDHIVNFEIYSVNDIPEILDVADPSH